MKKWILLCGLWTLSFPALYAQHLDMQSSTDAGGPALFERVTRLEKKTDAFNLYLNMQGSFNVYFNNGNEEQTSFRMNQLRIEAKGNITDRIYYRYRQRLNRANNAQSLDNLPTSIDYAAVGFHVTDQFSVFAGKQCTASFKEMYGKVPDNIEASKAPLGYTLNWNGSMLEDKLKTRWSASIFHEAKKQNWYYYALGTEVNLNRFIGFLDFMYSSEDLDRTGIISEITANDGYDTRALDTRYLSLVLHLNYRVLPKLNLFAKGMYETASVEKASDLLAKGKYRTSWGYLAGIEYYPMEENLHFFLNYIGRSFQYTDKAKVFGVGNSNPQRIELGLVYQLPVF